MRELLETALNYADAHYLLAIIAYRESRLDEAQSQFRKATNLNRDDGRYRLNLGVVLQRKHDLRNAEKYHRKSITATSEYAATHYSLGVVLQMQRRTVEAEQAYRSALKLDPDHKTAPTGGRGRSRP